MAGVAIHPVDVFIDGCPGPGGNEVLLFETVAVSAVHSVYVLRHHADGHIPEGIEVQFFHVESYRVLIESLEAVEPDLFVDVGHVGLHLRIVDEGIPPRAPGKHDIIGIHGLAIGKLDILPQAEGDCVIILVFHRRYFFECLARLSVPR